MEPLNADIILVAVLTPALWIMVATGAFAGVARVIINPTEKPALFWNELARKALLGAFWAFSCTLVIMAANHSSDNISVPTGAALIVVIVGAIFADEAILLVKERVLARVNTKKKEEPDAEKKAATMGDTQELDQ